MTAAVLGSKITLAGPPSSTAGRPGLALSGAYGAAVVPKADVLALGRGVAVTLIAVGRAAELTRRLGIAVTGDGVGFDPAKITDAGGLKRLDGRLAAVRGTLAVPTGRTGGARLAGRAPSRARVLQ